MDGSRKVPSASGRRGSRHRRGRRGGAELDVARANPPYAPGCSRPARCDQRAATIRAAPSAKTPFGTPIVATSRSHTRGKRVSSVCSSRARSRLAIAARITTSGARCLGTRRRGRTASRCHRRARRRSAGVERGDATRRDERDVALGEPATSAADVSGDGGTGVPNGSRSRSRRLATPLAVSSRAAAKQPRSGPAALERRSADADDCPPAQNSGSNSAAACPRRNRTRSPPRQAWCAAKS